MAVVSRVWEQTELPMEEDDGVAAFQKIFGRRRSSCARTEIVDEANRLSLQRDRGSARCHQCDASTGVGMEFDKVLRPLCVLVERRWRGIFAEIIPFRHVFGRCAQKVRLGARRGHGLV